MDTIKMIYIASVAAFILVVIGSTISILLSIMVLGVLANADHKLDEIAAQIQKCHQLMRELVEKIKNLSDTADRKIFYEQSVKVRDDLRKLHAELQMSSMEVKMTSKELTNVLKWINISSVIFPKRTRDRAIVLRTNTLNIGNMIIETMIYSEQIQQQTQQFVIQQGSRRGN